MLRSYQSYIYNSGGEIEAIYYKKNVYYYIKNAASRISLAYPIHPASGLWTTAMIQGAIF